ncbi:MAG: FAD-dependent oxidoreductase [Deltaproteobacteria bacterium]|nr:FAD-dependent oxidoreductase [Deltaproteobacteria bacterium]
MALFEFILDGVKVPAEDGDTILEAAARAGLSDRIPTLCHEPGLPPYTSCYVCVVEQEGRDKLLPACSSPAAPGMVLFSHSPKVVASRKTALELLLSDHPADCVAPCSRGCPAGIDVQTYLAQARGGLWEEAVRTIRERNPLPGICGRVCVRKCEDVCRRELLDEQPVGINMVKRAVADHWMETPYAEAPGPDTGKRVAIVGGGPAGLTAAYYLRRMGHGVTVFEMREKLGGMLRYGIPDYRLPQDILDFEIGRITDLGVEIHTGSRAGAAGGPALADLRSRFDAVFLSVGAQAGSPAQVEGEDHPSVLSGVEFLGGVVRGERFPVEGRKVAVVGGGNTAIDAARTALRLGAEHVTILYRRTRAEMPANPEEIEAAEHEGVRIEYLIAPVRIAAEGDRLQGIVCRKMVLGEPDASGRRRPVPVEGSEHLAACDLVLAAIGQKVDLSGLTDGLAVTRWGTLQADEWSSVTSMDGVFAGGDGITGPAVVIDAIAHGRRAALSMDQYLRVGAPRRAVEIFSSRKENFGEVRVQDLPPGLPGRRQRQDELPAEERVASFDEVEATLAEHQVVAETARCLSCGCAAAETCTLRSLAEEYGLDDSIRGQTVRHRLDDSHHRITLDPDKCILCTRCIRTCGEVLGIAVLGLVNRGFETTLSPSLGRPLAGTACIACGNCVDACPTGALSFKDPAASRRSRGGAPSVCTLCGELCAVELATCSFGLSARPPETDGPRQLLCELGRHGLPELAAGERLTRPLVRREGRLVSATWDEALAAALHGLSGVAREHGPASLLLAGGGALSWEEAALLARLGREGFGARTGSLSVLAEEGDGYALDGILDATRSTASWDDVEAASVLLVVGEDPMAAARLRRAVRRGARIVALTSAPTRVARLAEVWVETRRGSSSRVLGWLAKELVRRRGAPEELVQAFPDLAFDCLLQDCGVEPAAAQRALEVLAGAGGPVVGLASLDPRAERSPGTLPALTGVVQVLGGTGAGSGLLLFGRHANRLGLLAAGLLPGDGASGGELEAAIHKAAIRGAWLVREDPDENRDLAVALADLRFLVVQDCFLTATAARADVVLPASTHLEAGGTFVRHDGRILRALPGAPGRVERSVARVLAEAAALLGLPAAPAAGPDAALDRLPCPGKVGWILQELRIGVPRTVHGEVDPAPRHVTTRRTSWLP